MKFKGKQCSRCKVFKLFEEFSTKKGSWCKSCHNEYSRISRFDPIRRQKKDACVDKKRKEYLVEWGECAIKLYGALRCEVCKCDLDWYSMGNGRNKNVVTFDHRCGDEVLDKTRSIMNWMCNRPPSEKHIAVFKACDFGMVCGPCNSDLGRSENRLERNKAQYEYITRGPI